MEIGDWSCHFVLKIKVVLLKKLNEVIAGVMELDHLDAVSGRVYHKSQHWLSDSGVVKVKVVMLCVSVPDRP